MLYRYSFGYLSMCIFIYIYIPIFVTLKKAESPLECKEIIPELAKAPVLGPPDVKSRLIGKDSDAGKH